MPDEDDLDIANGGGGGAGSSGKVRFFVSVFTDNSFDIRLARAVNSEKRRHVQPSGTRLPHHTIHVHHVTGCLAAL
jgi:hypothetical protein